MVELYIQHLLDDFSGVVHKEPLPYPYVLYPKSSGTFIGFKERLTTDWVLCECSYPALSSWLHYQCIRNNTKIFNRFDAILDVHQFPSELVSQFVDVKFDCALQLINGFNFKQGICHLCSGGVPSKFHSPRAYGTHLENRFGWYIEQQKLAWGLIKPPYIFMPQYLPEILWELWVNGDEIETGEAAQFLNKDLICQSSASLEDVDRFKKVRRTVHQAVRERIGLTKMVGLNEFLMFRAVCQLFPEERVIRNTRPSWLKGLELDVFLPCLHLAFEYQGRQHYVSVQHWGGDEALINQKRRDAQKKRLCKKNSVLLLIVNYREVVTVELIRKKLLTKGIVLD